MRIHLIQYQNQFHDEWKNLMAFKEEKQALKTVQEFRDDPRTSLSEAKYRIEELDYFDLETVN